MLCYGTPFNVQPQKTKVVPTPVNFSITPDTMQNVREVRNANHNWGCGFDRRFSHFVVCVQRNTLPKFLVRGHLDATNCVITQPLTGELQVENSEVPIKSIELQLVRVETCGEETCCKKTRRAGEQSFTLLCLSSPGCAEGYARDATEIQNIQIAEGDVCRSLPIPIYMVFPRLFTCPTLETTNFKVGQWMCLCFNQQIRQTVSS